MSEARDLLRSLLAEVLAENGNGHAPAPPAPSGPRQVPAPPTAAVLRPSTWDRPAAPGEIIGDGAAPAPAGGADRPGPSAGADGPSRSAGPGPRRALGPGGGAERVSLASDADLDRFVRALAKRCDDPRERAAIKAGALRFTLGGGASTAGTMRIESGAVTEKTVREAAASGARLVLAPRAVMTPLARERARALKVEVERERRC